MADETKTLAWRLMVNVTGIEKSTREAANSLAKVETAAQKATKLLREFGVVLGIAAVAKATQELLKIADAYIELANSLRDSTSSAQELQAVQLELIQVAHDSRATVETTVESFNRLHDATEGLGLSHKEVIDLTKTLTQTMRLSGLSAEKATSGVIKFATALEIGTMTMKEFKSTIRESPELVEALANGMGVSVQEMRLMAEQGKLTTATLLDALSKAAPGVEAKFNELVPTMKDAFASLKSGFGALLGEFNEGAGITANLARGINSLGETFAEWAKKAQLVGIAVKVAVGEIAIRFVAMHQQGVAAIEIVINSFNKMLSFFAGGLFKEALQKREDFLVDHFKEVGRIRDEAIRLMKADADAEADSLFGANLNAPTPIAPTVATAEQTKQMESFLLSLVSLKNKAGDAATEMQALNMELQDGKKAADGFRAQMAAAQSGRDLMAQAEKQFAEAKTVMPEGLRSALQFFIDMNAKAAVQVKATSESVSLISAAMAGAMSDTERAAKATAELTAAYEELKAKLKPDQIILVEQALANIAKQADKVPQSLRDALGQIETQGRAAADSMEALRVEIEQGQAAGDAFRTELAAVAQANELKKQFKKAFEDAGLKFGPEQEKAIDSVTKSMANNTTEAQQMEEAWRMVNAAINDGMTETERAEKAVNDLNAALEFLQKHKVSLTPEQIAQFKENTKKISEGASFITRTWKDAAQTIIGGFVDFLADGEFNTKRFVTSMIQQIGRLIIQATILNAIAGTKWGKALGITAGANGLALDHGRLVPMASGGIVSSPTMFPMAGGQVGLMGEAGPEAVMPLARLSSGKLGVSAEPSNIQVVNNTGVQANARIERGANRTSIILEAAQLGAQLAEERITRSMRSGYGATSTALQGTYGLRRRG